MVQWVKVYRRLVITSIDSILKRALKEERMKKLVGEVLNCRRCRLCNGRRNPVVGEGDVEASVVFVGEAPGHWEDKMGRPFVGSAGRLLDRLLGHVGLERSKVYITNVVKCRPPENRRPRSDEIGACTPFLEEQLEIIAPRILAPMGNSATGYMMKWLNLGHSSMGDAHGRKVPAKAPWGRVIIFPLYHPAAALYDRNLETEMMADFESLRRLLDAEGSPST